MATEHHVGDTTLCLTVHCSPEKLPWSMTSPIESTPSTGVDTQAVAMAVEAAVPGSTILSVEPMGPDATENSDVKRIGYGEPLLIRLRLEDGQVKEVVFHTATDNPFGHQHRADRAHAMLLAYDTFPAIPRHAHAVDVGAVVRDGTSVLSLRDAGEFYLLTEFVPGYVYADDLRTLSERGELLERDLDRANDLASYLAELHTRYGHAELYRRSVRDVLGSGEGIFGIIDGYPNSTPGVPRVVLERIERLCLPWRWKLRDYEHRASRIHGDFHPFNVVFSDDGLRLLDASRGSYGEPADDVICMAINYVFFALLWPGTWKPCFRRLWNTYWNTYLSESGDAQVLEVVAPYLAWRALVLSNPNWYPTTPAVARERLLGVVEQVLVAPRFDPGCVETLFRDEEPRSAR